MKKKTFFFFFFALIAFSFSLYASEDLKLNEAEVKQNVFKMIKRLIKIDGYELQDLTPDSIIVQKTIPIRVDSLDLFAVKVKLPKIEYPSSRIPPEIAFVTNKDGKLRFRDINELDSGKSLIESTLQQLAPKEKQIKIPSNFGTTFFRGDGKHEIIFVSDPFCPFCGKAYLYFMKNKNIIKKINLAHFPLPMHPGAAMACWAIKDAEKKGLAAQVIDFVYTGLKPSREEMKGGLEKVRLDVAAKIAKKFPMLAGGMDAEKFSNYLKTEYEAAVKKDRDAVLKLGIRSAPYIFIDGKMLRGFNQSKIEKLLKKQSN